VRKLIITNQFRKSYISFTKQNPQLINKIETTLTLMEEDIFQKSLFTHKLSGNLFGLRACSCGYDCRIIFRIEKNSLTSEEEIILLNIGTHETVY
jgi:mRNA interferase YafQ